MHAVSSVSAIGADATAPALYARTKAIGEQLVLAAVPDAVILRPSVVFGPEDDFFNKFAAMARIALSEVERVLRGEKPLHAVNEVR